VLCRFSLALNRGRCVRASIISQLWRYCSMTEVKNCTLKPYFYIFVARFLYIQTCVTTSLVYTCKHICQTSARKPRNQCKHQQLCANFLSRAEGSKYAHWIGLYLSFHLSWVFGPFVRGRLQNLQTSEDTFGHDNSFKHLLPQWSSFSQHCVRISLADIPKRLSFILRM